MPDRYGVLWVRTAAGPMKMGNLISTGQETRFSYTPEFLQAQPAAGLSLLTNPDLYGERPVVHRASETLPLHPRLMALIPPARNNNLQRRIYAEILARRDTPPAPGFDTEWELLMLAGHNGIGHIDVFRDDQAAQQGYERQPTLLDLPQQRSRLWHWIKDDVRLGDEEQDLDIAGLIGPTPSVGGMIPKLLVAIPDTEHWDGSIAVPGTAEKNATSYTDVVLKIEQPEYAGIAALEAASLDLHRQLGFITPRYWRTEVDGLRLLAIERFDRDAAGLPIAMESFYSVLATGAHDIRGSTDADMARIGQMLTKLGELVNIDVKAAHEEVYRRFTMALLTGNGDLHLENLAFLGGHQDVRIAPVFDPTPMRAWQRHDLLCAISFDIEDGLRESWITVAQHFGLSAAKASQILDELGAQTEPFMHQIQDLADVPAAAAQRLCTAIQSARQKLLP